MEQVKSLWLGRFRGPTKLALKVTCGITLATYLILIIQRMFFDGQVGVHEMLRPEGGIIAQIMLISLFASLVLAGVYFSDTRGEIEPDHSGPFDIVSLVCSRIAMISIVFIEIVMFYEVVSRYVFSRPTLWANELSLWIASFLFLLAGMYAMQQRSHIRIFIIYEMFPRWAKKAADTFSVMLIVLFSTCLVWGAFDEAVVKFERFERFGTAWDPPIPATVKPAILIIICMVTLQAVSNLIADWNKEDVKHTPADDVDQTEIENIRKTLEDR
jgi:TRAP-type C4-dicarboxylate transport system permease small subunit